MPVPIARRGEVWIIDLGYVGKIRPCVIFNVPALPHERTLIAYVPVTSSVAGTRYEVVVKAKFIRADSVIDGQQISTWPAAKLIRKIGALTTQQLELVEAAVKEWLGLA